MFDTESVEYGHVGADAERSARGVGVGVGVVRGKTTAEGEVLPGTGVDAGQAAVLRSVERYLLLFHAQFALLDAEAVLQRMVYALRERPDPLLRLSPGGERRQKGRRDDDPSHGYSTIFEPRTLVPSVTPLLISMLTPSLRPVSTLVRVVLPSEFKTST